MPELSDEQVCPYCEHIVEDSQSVWEGEEEVTCDSCRKVYVSKPQYKFEGWLIEKQCEECGEWTDEGYKLCDCGEETED